jgi:hypothetical protein
MAYFSTGVDNGDVGKRRAAYQRGPAVNAAPPGAPERGLPRRRSQPPSLRPAAAACRWRWLQTGDLGVDRRDHLRQDERPAGSPGLAELAQPLVRLHRSARMLGGRNPQRLFKETADLSGLVSLASAAVARR